MRLLIENRLRELLDFDVSALEKYYQGDDCWRKFAETFYANWEQCSIKNELFAAMGRREDLAKVIFAAVGDSALTWIDNPIPALDGLSPRECLRAEVLQKRLLVMLRDSHFRCRLHL
jgi:hypothetical protein